MNLRGVLFGCLFLGSLGCQSAELSNKNNGEEMSKAKNETSEKPKFDTDKYLSVFVQRQGDKKPDMLYAPSEPVPLEEIQTPKIQNLIKEMRQRMEEAGIGLAANQVGNHLRLFVIGFENPQHGRYPNRFAAVPFQVFINPKITKASAETISFWHGCLSCLGADLGKVATWTWIEYEAYDENGALKKGRLTDLAAVIFQHELRHLQGGCYLDHAVEFKNGADLAKDYEAGLDPMLPCGPEVPHLLSDYQIGITP